MTTCSAGSTWKTVTHTGALAVALGLCLGSSGVAFAADATAPTTVRAAIGADGAVRSVVSLGGNTTAPDKAALPVTMSITDQLDGKDLGADRAGQDSGQLASTFHIENTSSKNMPVSFTDADGTTKTANQDVALPLVAELTVSLPASFSDVVAEGARIAANADGSHELTWSMVLFAPLGSPTNVVSYTAKTAGKGSPVARLETRAVVPNATPGLAASGQAANVVIAGNGTLTALADGANEGLGKLSAGVGQLLAGLGKLSAGANALHDGLGAGADGTNKLADGLHVALKGSGDLATGLGKLSAGNSKLAGGTQQLADGSGKLSAGLAKASAGSEKLVDGSQALATGAGLTADGAAKLSAGLAQISGGLTQLGGVAGLPAALAGATALKSGVDQIVAGLGSATTAGTILNGLAGLDTGLTTVKGGLDQLIDPARGLPVAVAGVNQIKNIIDTQILPGLGTPGTKAPTVRFAVDQVRLGLATASTNGASLDQLQGAAKALALYIDPAVGGPCPFPFPAPPSPPATPCQILATVYDGIGQVKTSSAAGAAALQGAGVGLTTITGGLGQISIGLRSNDPANPKIGEGLDAAVKGLQALDAGVGLKTDGAASIRGGLALVTGGVNTIAAGLRSGDPAKPGVSEGLDALVTGLTAAVSGVTQLSTGAASAAAGSAALADGTKKVAAGAGDLSELGAVPIAAGLAQLFVGSQALQTGLMSANSGAQQLAAGAKTAAAGSVSLSSGIGQISAGEDKVAAGLPAAVDGAGKIADGLGKVVDGETAVGKGLGDVKKQATNVLASQLKEGTANANRQLAGLEAVGNRVNEPGAATTTYVLTQEGGASKLALAGNSSDSHVARNVGLGVAGLLLLLAGLAGGFVRGRKVS